MPSLKIQEEIDAYYLSDPAHPRAAGVLWPALVERRVDKLFEVALRRDEKVRNELFQPSGALGSYAVKVRLAYMLGWFGEDFYGDLLLVAKIRNRFAHAIEAKNFSDQKISAWLRSMNAYQFLPRLLDRAKKSAEAEKTVNNMALLSIYEDALHDPRMGFRFCIDLMLHRLDGYRENMERNLSNLASNWLVADEAPQKVDDQTTREEAGPSEDL